MIERAEFLISQVLRFGVLLCGLIIGFGWILSVRTAVLTPGSQDAQVIAELRQGHRLDQANNQAIHPAGTFSIADLTSGLTQWQPHAWMTLGLLLLIALPVLRVALTVVVFAIERDGIYVLLSGTVLVILVISFVLGKEL